MGDTNPTKDRERRLRLVGPTTWMGHLFDAIAFRAFGGWVIGQEATGETTADKWVLATGVALFFIPDWLRGRNSALLQLIVGRFGRDRNGE